MRVGRIGPRRMLDHDGHAFGAGALMAEVGVQKDHVE